MSSIHFFWDFLNIFNFAKPVTLLITDSVAVIITMNSGRESCITETAKAFVICNRQAHCVAPCLKIIHGHLSPRPVSHRLVDPCSVILGPVLDQQLLKLITAAVFNGLQTRTKNIFSFVGKSVIGCNTHDIEM